MAKPAALPPNHWCVVAFCAKSLRPAFDNPGALPGEQNALETHPSRNRGCVVVFCAEALRPAAVRRPEAPCPANKMNGEHKQPMLLEAENAYSRRCLRASSRYTCIVCKHARMQAHMRTGVWDYAQQSVCERRPCAIRPETSTRDAASFHTHVVHDVWARASWLAPPLVTPCRAARNINRNLAMQRRTSLCD